MVPWRQNLEILGEIWTPESKKLGEIWTPDLKRGRYEPRTGGVMSRGRYENAPLALKSTIKSLKQPSKLVGLGVLVISCGLFVNQAIICIGRFVSQETQISLEVLSSSTAMFPHLTICPDYHDAYKVDILQKCNTSASHIRKYKFPQVPNMTTYEFYNFITLELSEVLYTIKVTNPINMHNRQIFSVTYTQHPTAPEQWYLITRIGTLNDTKPLEDATLLSYRNWFYKQRSKRFTWWRRNPLWFTCIILDNFLWRALNIRPNLELWKQFFMETRHELTIDYSKRLTEKQLTWKTFQSYKIELSQLWWAYQK